MIDLIRRVLTRKSRIRDLILERDKFAAHLVRLQNEMDTVSGHLDRVIRERYQLDPKKHPNFKYFLSGHYYSPIPSLDEVKKDEDRLFSNPKTIPGVDLNVEGQVALLDQLKTFYETFPFKSQKTKGLRYSLGNLAFGGADAVFLYAMLRH